MEVTIKSSNNTTQRLERTFSIESDESFITVTDSLSGVKVMKLRLDVMWEPDINGLENIQNCPGYFLVAQVENNNCVTEDMDHNIASFYFGGTKS